MAETSHSLAQLPHAVRHLREFEQLLRELGIAPERFSGYAKAVAILEQVSGELPAGSASGWDRVSAPVAPDGAALSPSNPEVPFQGCLITDAQGIILEANQAAADLFSTRREFLVGKPLSLLVVKEQRAAFYVLLSRLPTLAGLLRGWQFHLQPRGKTAAFIPVHLSVKIQTTQPLQFEWLLNNLARAVWAEQALETAVAFSDTLMDTAQAIVLVLDEKGQILRCNPYACRAAGSQQFDLLYREWYQLLPLADRPTARGAVLQALAFGLSRTLRTWMRTNDGSERAIAWSLKPLQPGTSGVHGVLVLGQDITELEEAQQQALQAERLATIGQVTAALAHESRNLLQISRAALERLSWRLQDRPEALALVQRIEQAQMGLHRLFEDVRGYAAPLQLDCRACQLNVIWRETWEQVCVTFPGREAVLEEDVSGMDLWYSADAFRLGQVFRNLFENAFAACSGAVRVQILCRDAHPGGRPAIRVAVRDNGPGLNEEQRRRIFEPFYTTRLHGTGLGTAIAKRIVEAHGGQMSVGQDGAGAEIILLLPRSNP